MGMDYTISGENVADVSWTVIADILRERGYPVEMRMIDNELAFPDESPPENWQELRVGAQGGMITIRRDGNVLRTVTWGNADDALRKAWNAVTWATASSIMADIVHEDERWDAHTFLTKMSFPEEFGPAQ